MEQASEKPLTRPSYLILGSTGVIGRVLCERLAKRGVSLVLGGRDPKKLNELAVATGGEACPGDARDAATVERAVAQAVERYGRLDGAVNLVNPIESSLFEPAHSPQSEDGNERVVVNLRPAFHLVHSAAKAVRGEGGSIVLVSPATATSGTVNREANAAALANRLTDLPTSLAAWKALRHIGCTSDPEDVAAAISWLLDPGNSRVFGQVVSVDGGLALLHGGARA
jgi:NAD(P)-dependent dehydrogenase (short-subunit alcohol dehydrogenase family)